MTMTCLIGVVVAGSLAKLGNAMPVATVAAVASDTSRAIRPMLLSVMGPLSPIIGFNVMLEASRTIGNAYDSHLARPPNRPDSLNRSDRARARLRTRTGWSDRRWPANSRANTH